MGVRTEIMELLDCEPDLNGREISERIGCSEPYAYKVKREYQPGYQTGIKYQAQPKPIAKPKIKPADPKVDPDRLDVFFTAYIQSRNATQLLQILKDNRLEIEIQDGWKETVIKELDQKIQLAGRVIDAQSKDMAHQKALINDLRIRLTAQPTNN